VDLGLKNFAITSEGSKYNLPKKQLAKLERNRKRKQKKLAQKTDKTSNKRRKAKLWVAKVSSKIARVREDFLACAISQDSTRKPSYLCRRFGS
jgi:putative transposase